MLCLFVSVETGQKRANIIAWAPSGLRQSSERQVDRVARRSELTAYGVAPYPLVSLDWGPHKGEGQTLVNSINDHFALTISQR